MNNELCSEWIKKQLPVLLEDYSLGNIYNAVDTRDFFKAVPDKATVFKGEACHGRKQSKDRVTLLLSASMSGTDKLAPLDDWEIKMSKVHLRNKVHSSSL